MKLARYAVLVFSVIIGMNVGVFSNVYAASSSNLPAACRSVTGDFLCASKSKSKLYIVSNGRIVSSGAMRYGIPSKMASDGTKGYFTREDTFHVGNIRDKYAVSNLYSSATGQPIPMPYFVQFSGGQGIHYSSEFAKTGYKYSSHGCINLRSMSFAKNVNKYAKPNMSVIVTSQ